MTTKRRAPGEAILLLVLLAVAILSVVGIALKVSTDAERASAGQEWAIGRALYAADAGIRWAAARMRTPEAFLSRPEFTDPPDPFGRVWLPLPSHRHGDSGPFSGDPADDGIRAMVEAPSYLGRRPRGDPSESLFDYAFEVRVRATEDTTVPRWAWELVADVEVGPLPGDFPASGARDIIHGVHSTDETAAARAGAGIRSVVWNWKEP